jgi:hypothetical protein
MEPEHNERARFGQVPSGVSGGGIHEHEKEELKNLDDVAGSFVQ